MLGSEFSVDLKLSFCHKLKYSNLKSMHRVVYIFDISNLDYFTKRIQSLKSTTLGCKDKGIKISEFVAKIWKTYHFIQDLRGRLSLSCITCQIVILPAYLVRTQISIILSIFVYTIQFELYINLQQSTEIQYSSELFLH